jgi:ABC-type Fe3+-hydroxamate transport system substrate-binding protein
MQVVDQIGRTVQVPEHAQRIVSLVPSQTELLHTLGAGDRIVGITKFCVHPYSWSRSKERIGGTKKIHLDRVAALKPDLIIANKEENLKADVLRLAESYPVWISDVKDIGSALEMIRAIGTIIGEQASAVALTDEINELLPSIKPLATPMRAVYLIWRKPYMAAGQGTFIASMMELLGLENVVSEDRYPELSAAALAELKPDIVLYSSEPYPFTDEHVAEIRALLPHSRHQLVDGEAFSWFGSRIPHGLRYIQTVAARLGLDR